MEWSTDALKNNNYVAEPVTFIVVPHRRYTLPFVARNIYIEELVNDNNENQDNFDFEPSNHHEVSFNEEEHLILNTDSENERPKDKLSQVLNNIFQNLFRETRSGVFRKGRLLKRKLGLQRRSRSAGYLVRDRFKVFPPCPCCRKLKELKKEISSKPAVLKLRKIVKSNGKKAKESLRTMYGGMHKNKEKIPELVGGNPNGKIMKETPKTIMYGGMYENTEKNLEKLTREVDTGSILDENPIGKENESLKTMYGGMDKNEANIPEKLTREVDADSLVDENPDQLEITPINNRCFVFKKLMELKKDVIQCCKDRKGNNKVIERKSSSSFYVDNRDFENLLRNEYI